MEKKLDRERKRLQANYPAAEVEVWAMDEHRLGLSPSTAPCLGATFLNSQPPQLTGVTNGYGSMALFILNLEKLIGGFCPRSI